MAMGVFLDNEIMYDRALRYFTGLPCRPDDIPYQSGPPIISENPVATNDFFRTYTTSGYHSTIPDYGFNGVLKYYFWENGQGQESSRDQDHNALGIGMAASMAEIAWNQGDDVYSMYDNRILKAYEWGLRYNVSYKYPFPDQPTPWEPAGYTAEEGVATFENSLYIQRHDRSGRWYSLNVSPHYESNLTNISRGNFKGNKRPVYEVAMAHYGIREGLDPEKLKWTKRALDISNDEYGYERTGWSLDHLGWGGLTFHRKEWMAGDPGRWENGERIHEMPMLPCTIKAVDYDFFTGNGEGRTYHNKGTEKSALYRTDGTVEIIQDDGNFVVTNMETDEWMNYTIGVPATGNYDIYVEYKASAKAGLKFAVYDGTPATGTLNASKDYIERKVTGIKLPAGACVLRMEVTGASNVLQVRSIRIVASK